MIFSITGDFAAARRIDVVAEKVDRMLVDRNRSGRVDPGEVVEYAVRVHNTGTVEGHGGVFTDMPDPNTLLVAGSVTTTQGVVSLGNVPGDRSVIVELGTLAPEDPSATITFQVQVTDPLPANVLTLANQGTVSGDDFPTRSTDDPDTSSPLDPTLTALANQPVDRCERALDDALSDVDLDGVLDIADQCPDTLAGEAIDLLGCSVRQFCASFGVSRGLNPHCALADWRNDEPVAARDCRLRHGRCVPR